MKFRHLEYFVAAAEELNFTHAADRLHVSQPPFSKQIHDLEGELGIDLFERQRKGVTLTPAGKSFLVDARRILEDCDASIRKAQRISRGEIGELTIGYISALTHDFLRKALEVWRLTAHKKNLTPAGKSFLVDARRILEDCDASIRKAQRISRGEIGELTIGYISALTHDFLRKALEVWRLTAPGIVIDCLEMDSV